jgi:AcrR family transcriptional regulator
MARKPETAAGAPPRERIVDAVMALAAEGPWDAVSLPMIAERAGMSLADLRDAFPSKGAILAAFSRRIDRIVLEGGNTDMAAEPARERVLDIMLRRFDALAPHKAALKSIHDGVRHDPLALAALNKLAVNSWRYMLAAADIDTEDHLGSLKVQGAALVFARALPTWFEDDDPGLSRTMLVVERELKRGEALLRWSDDVHRLTAPFRGFFRAAMEGRREARERRRHCHREDGPPDERAA